MLQTLSGEDVIVTFRDIPMCKNARYGACFHFVTPDGKELASYYTNHTPDYDDYEPDREVDSSLPALVQAMFWDRV